MRLVVVILAGVLSGCHLGGGHQQACAPEGCQECSRKGCVACPTGLCPGRCAKYSRCCDNVHTRRQARKWAREDLREMDSKCLSCDFRLGYEQAYVDVAQGASGRVPALPPAHYWKDWARTPEGHERAQVWFAGYAAGAERAISSYEPYNQVASSGAPGYPDSEWGPAAGTWQSGEVPSDGGIGY